MNEFETAKSNNRLYSEAQASKSLMEINLYYMNKQNLNLSWPKKMYRLLRKIKYKLRRLKNALLHARKYGLYKTKTIIKSVFIKSEIENYNIAYPKNQIDEVEYISTNKKVSKKIVVYTSVFGNYDKIKDPFYVSPYCDYYAITDQVLSKDSAWIKKETSMIPGFNSMDDYHKSKFCKLHPHVLFPDYDFSIWIDGNAQIVGDLYPLVDRLSDDRVMGTFENPLHDCVYTEGKYIIVCNAANTDVLLKQLDSYKREGFPAHFGMREFSIIVRMHNDENLIKLMNQWWNEVNTFTMRDQISFPYILWKNGYNIDYIQKFRGNWRHNPRFICSDHTWRHVIK